MICSCNLDCIRWKCAGVKPHEQIRTYTINTTDRGAVLHAESMLSLCKQNYCITSSYRYIVMLLWVQTLRVKNCRYNVISVADKCLLNIKKVYSIANYLGVLVPAARVMHKSHIYTYYTTYYIAAQIATKALASVLYICRYIPINKYRYYYIHYRGEPYSFNAVLMSSYVLFLHLQNHFKLKIGSNMAKVECHKREFSKLCFWCPKTSSRVFGLKAFNSF